MTTFLLLLLINPLLTPGAIRPLTLTEVCTTRWGTDSRHVSLGLKARVYKAYGIPVADRGLYVIDHKIPRDLAGADAFENLWPELRAPAHIKDTLEKKLHRDVCAPHPTITLEAAQQQMRVWAKD